MGHHPTSRAFPHFSPLYRRENGFANPFSCGGRRTGPRLERRGPARKERDDARIVFCYCLRRGRLPASPRASFWSRGLSSTVRPPRQSLTSPSWAKYFSIRLTTSRALPI